MKNYGLRLARDTAALLNSDSNLMVILHEDPAPRLPLFERIFASLAGSKRSCFVYGLAGFPSAFKIDQMARAHSVPLQSGTEAGHLFRLPEVELPARPRRSLLVVQGPFPQAEARALEALASVSDLAKSPSRIESATALKGSAVWNAAYSAEWLPLFSAAISRSNTIQGDPEKDGRTQDIVGLHIVEKLAKTPRAWTIRFAHGAHTAIFVLDGALADYNFAAQSSDGRVHSTQLYHPPAPQRDAFSRMAEDLLRQSHMDSHSFVLSTLDKMRAQRSSASLRP
jgi:hypothetical protein